LTALHRGSTEKIKRLFYGKNPSLAIGEKLHPLLWKTVIIKVLF